MMKRLAGAAGLLGFLILAGCKGNINNGSLPLTTTDRVSVGTGGIEGNGAASELSISEDGNLVAFSSSSTNLVPLTGPAVTNIFLRNISAKTTELISINAAGTGSANGASTAPRISADGRFVVYQSLATDLLVGDVNAAGAVYVREVAKSLTLRVTVDNGGGDTAAGCGNPAISQDGQFIAFTAALNGVPAGTATGAAQVHRRDMNLNPGTAGYIIRISANSGGGAVTQICANPSISGDGAFITFNTGDPGLLSVVEVGGTDQDVFLWSQGGPGSGITRLSNAFGGGEATGQSTNASISLDGQWVAYQSSATNLLSPNVTASPTNIFRVPRVGGNSELVSVSSDGQPASGGTGSLTPSISRDGRRIAFTTDSANLFPGDINSAFDIVVRDTVTGSTFSASVLTYGAHTEFLGSSIAGVISGDGKNAAFWSLSAILAPGDNNAQADVFRRGPF